LNWLEISFSYVRTFEFDTPDLW